MVFGQFIRYTGLAVGLKPSAMECEARLRGLERIMYSKTITSAIHAARAPHTDGMNILPGRAQPSQTLPRVGEWGNPVSPFPCGAGAWGNPVSPHPPSEELYSR